MDITDLISMAGCWDILKIEKTDDKKAVKKAYFKLLKDNNPEEKPEEFQEIRQAYEAALMWIKREADKDADPAMPVPPVGDSSSLGNPPSIKNPSFNEKSPPIPPKEKQPSVQEQFGEIYDDFSQRRELENWKTLVNRLSGDTIESRITLGEELLLFFMYHVHLPQLILSYFDEAFSWSEQIWYYKKKYSQQGKALDSLYDRIQLPIWDLDYGNLVLDHRLGNYLELRDKAVEKVEIKDFKKALMDVDLLERICPGDLTLASLCNRIQKEKRKERELYKQVLKTPHEPLKSGEKVLVLIVLLILFFIAVAIIFERNPSSPSYSSSSDKKIFDVVKPEDIAPFALDITTDFYDLTGENSLGTISLSSSAESHRGTVLIMWDSSSSAEYSGGWVQKEGKLSFRSDEEREARESYILILEVTDYQGYQAEQESLPSTEEGERLFAFFMDDLWEKMISNLGDSSNEDLYLLGRTLVEDPTLKGVFILPKE
jgi:hypothetical protein